MNILPLLRRLAAGFALVAIALVTMLQPRASAQELMPIKVRTSWTPGGLQTAIFYAMERGWMKEGGLDLQVEDGSGSTSTVALLGSGQYDIGEAAVSAMIVGRGKGLPLKAIACFIRATDTGLLVPRGSGIASAKDLEGRKILYTAASLEGPFMVPFLKAGGADPRKVDLVNVDFSAKIPSYIAGQGDAVVSTVPFVLPLVAQSRPSEPIMFSKYGLVLPGMGYIASEQTIRTKARALRVFVQATSRAWQDILQQNNINDAVAAELKHRPQAKLKPEEVRGQIEAYRDYFYTEATKAKPIGWQSPEDWSAALRSMQQANLIAAGVAPADFYTNEFYE
jgi:NitT/TauT family transport system substrate-binding protein